MDYLARRRQEMLEAMESCRAGSDDLSDPRFAELAAALADDLELRVSFQRIQRSDAAIKAAFTEVSLPAGLAERISRRLAESAPSRMTDSISADPIVATTPDSRAPLQPDHVERKTQVFSRRRLLVGTAALATSAALLTAVWLHNHHQAPITPGRVIDEAMDFFGRDHEPQGELVSRIPPPADFAISRDVRQSPLMRWRHVQNFLGGQAVAYDLPVMGGRATLYVVDRTVAGLQSFPPAMPLSTGGNSAAAWQTGDMLYVLVVQGDAQTYFECLDHSSGPLT